MTIPILPDGPTSAMSRAAFIAAANSLVAALNPWGVAVNAAAAAFGVTQWNAVTVYAVGDRAWSPVDFQTYRRKTIGASATDPSADSANWAYVTASLGTYALRGLTGVPNTTAKMDFNCDQVVLVDTGGQTIRRSAPGSKTCDTGTQGRNGRDQAGVFSNQWVHFYYTWDGATIATRCSVVAPPTGPTLANGETHWAYIGAIYFTTSLRQVYIRGSKAYYQAGQAALSGGTSTSYASVSVSTLVPSNAPSFSLFGAVSAGFTNNDWATIQLTLSSDGTNNMGNILLRAQNVNSAQSFGITGAFNEMPNVSQAFYYIIGTTGALTTGATATITITSYGIPNGG